MMIYKINVDDDKLPEAIPFTVMKAQIFHTNQYQFTLINDIYEIYSFHKQLQMYLFAYIDLLVIRAL